MDNIWEYLVAWIPPALLTAVGYGELRSKVRQNCSAIKKMQETNFMTNEQHTEICHLHQVNFNTRLLNMERDISEIKNEIKAGNKERTEARQELMEIIKTAMQRGN